MDRTPPQDAPPPERRHVPVGSVIAVVIGCLLLLPAFGALAGGSVLTWANNTQRDDDGYFTSTTHHLETLRSAITSDDIDLGFDTQRGTEL